MNHSFQLGVWAQYRASLRLTLRWGPLLLVHAIYPIIGIYFAYWLWQSGEPISWPYGLLIVVCFLFTPLIIFLSVLVRRAQSRGAFHDISVAVTDDGIKQEASVANTEVSWGKLLAVRETEEFFFFYITQRLAILLPKRVLNGEMERKLVRECIRQNAGAKARLLQTSANATMPN